jgi:DNA-binding PucR family transcriptional regulator
MTLALVRRNALPSERPTPTEGHLGDVILLHDDELARGLVERALAPLSNLSDGERTRLTETLQAWLAYQRHTPAVAEALHVHPQTVRYRIAKLRELLGDALETAEGRFELELALRARQALGGDARHGMRVGE